MGSLRGRWCLRVLIDPDSHFLIYRVNVDGRGALHRRLVVFLYEGDLSVFVIVTTTASNSTVHDDAQDPDEPEENTDTAA